MSPVEYKERTKQEQEKEKKGKDRLDSLLPPQLGHNFRGK